MLTGLLVLLFAILGFAVVTAIAAVILALLHAVLPSEDTEAAALHARELEHQSAERGDDG